jgi:hypothetical protein
MELVIDASRSPDDANIKNKMIFASSKDALRRRLDGESRRTQHAELLLPCSAPTTYRGCVRCIEWRFGIVSPY